MKLTSYAKEKTYLPAILAEASNDQELTPEPDTFSTQVASIVDINDSQDEKSCDRLLLLLFFGMTLAAAAALAIYYDSGLR